MQKKEKYWVWLSNLKLKKITYIKLLEKYKDPEKIYNLEKLELHNNDFLQNEEIEKIVSLKNMKKIEYFIEYMNNKWWRISAKIKKHIWLSNFIIL